MPTLTRAPARLVDPALELALMALEKLEALEQRVQRLEGRQPSRLERRAAAVLALAASVRHLSFTAVSVIRHAHQADPALLAALTAAGVETPRTLGRWLRTLQRTPLAGFRVERQGTNADGALWVFRSAD